MENLHDMQIAAAKKARRLRSIESTCSTGKPAAVSEMDIPASELAAKVGEQVMGLTGAIRKAEEQGKKAARRSLEQAMVSLDDAERAIRRRMRIYPHQSAAAPVANTARTGEVSAMVAPPLAVSSSKDDAELPPEDTELEGRKLA